MCPIWSRYVICYPAQVCVRTLYDVCAKTKSAKKIWEHVSLVKTTEVWLESLQDAGTGVTVCCSCWICEKMIFPVVGSFRDSCSRRGRKRSLPFCPLGSSVRVSYPVSITRSQQQRSLQGPAPQEAGRTSGSIHWLSIALSPRAPPLKQPCAWFNVPLSPPWSFNLKTESRTFILHSPCKLCGWSHRPEHGGARMKQTAKRKMPELPYAKLLSSKFITTWMS